VSITARILAGCSSALVVAGCLAKPALVPQMFSIDPPAVEEPRRSAGVYVVSVKKVQVSPPFDTRDLIYRTGEHRLERDPYASFAAPPGDMLTGAVRAYLRNAAFAREVVEPGEALRPDLLVEVYAAEISGDLRRPDDAAAVLTLRFLVTPGGADRHPGLPLLEKEYVSRIRLPRRTADAIATAWNQGLSGVMKEFVGDIEAVLARAPPSAAAGASH
jgi:cholesterol transport system auxiliary component